MQGHQKQNLNTRHINSCFWYNKGPYTRQANSSGFVLKWKSMWTVFWLLDKRLDFIRKVLPVFGNRNKGKDFGKLLGSESIKGYVAAIVDLWQVHPDSIRYILIIRVKSTSNEIMNPLRENTCCYNIFLND